MPVVFFSFCSVCASAHKLIRRPRTSPEPRVYPLMHFTVHVRIGRACISRTCFQHCRISYICHTWASYRKGWSSTDSGPSRTVCGRLANKVHTLDCRSVCDYCAQNWWTTCGPWVEQACRSQNLVLCTVDLSCWCILSVKREWEWSCYSTKSKGGLGSLTLSTQWSFCFEIFLFISSRVLHPQSFTPTAWSDKWTSAFSRIDYGLVRVL